MVLNVNQDPRALYAELTQSEKVATDEKTGGRGKHPDPEQIEDIDKVAQTGPSAVLSQSSVSQLTLYRPRRVVQ